VSAAATDLASIGANLDGAHAAAATPTTAIDLVIFQRSAVLPCIRCN
jgi:PE family